jgi:hypothetical protein
MLVSSEELGEETAVKDSATNALKRAILELGSRVVDRLGTLFRKRFTLVTSLEELGEQYQFNDPRYEVGVTHVWANIMERIPIEGDFNPNDGQAICAARCLGFVEIGRYIVAVVRQCWFGIEDPPIESFNLEPVFYTKTGQCIYETSWTDIICGINISFRYDESGGFVFEPDKVRPQYEDLPWGYLVKDIKPILIEHLRKMPSLISFYQ